MKVDIRKSFEKDAKKLPPNVQVRLFKIIEDISLAGKFGDLSQCKKLSGQKMLIGFDWEITGSVFSLKKTW